MLCADSHLAKLEVHLLGHEDVNFLVELLLHVGLGHAGQVGRPLRDPAQGQGAMLIGTLNNAVQCSAAQRSAVQYTAVQLFVQAMSRPSPHLPGQLGAGLVAAVG